jgi:hypothetical protein
MVEWGKARYGERKGGCGRSEVRRLKGRRDAEKRSAMVEWGKARYGKRKGGCGRSE